MNTTTEANTRKNVTLELEGIPLGAVVAMKKHLWEMLDLPDVWGDCTADLRLDVTITDEQRERVNQYLKDGWILHTIDEAR